MIARLKMTFPILAVAVSSAFCACKSLEGSRGSEVQTLDNFTRKDGAATDRSQCGSPLDSATLGRASAVIRAKDPRLGKVAAEVAAVAPPGVRSAFFVAGGQIVVTENIGDVCRQLPLTKAQKLFASEGGIRLESCWRQQGSGNPPVLYVDANEAVIRHALLRGLAFVFEEFFVQRTEALLASGGDARGTTGRMLSRFRQRSANLADALMEDLRGRGVEAMLRFSTFYQNDPENFRRFVLAEAIDSFYCSTKTRTSFERRFPRTWAAFAAVRRDLE